MMTSHYPGSARSQNQILSYALFLRAVNVAGKNMVPMAALRAIVEREGFGYGQPITHPLAGATLVQTVTLTIH